MISPQQELYSGLLVTLRARLPCQVHDARIHDGRASFPYVYMGEARQTDTPRKGIITGTVSITIHVWHDDERRRGDLSDIMARALNVCRSVPSDTLSFTLDTANQRILTDDTGEPVLLHGVLDVRWRFSSL